MKKTTFLCTFFLVTSLAVPALANNINLEINGKTIIPSVAPIMENGTTLVPLRIISEKIGAEVDWDITRKSITVSKENKIMKLQLDNTTVTINDIDFTLTVAPKIIENTTMVPIRFISENLGVFVHWDATSSTVQISKENNFIKPHSDATQDELAALKKANFYLSLFSFSYESLIEQLKFENITALDAIYAADNCGADWNEQAIKKAQSYLSLSPSSRSSLLSRLLTDKFTDAQANYAVDNCGADWNEQATKAAKTYISIDSYTDRQLIDKLKDDGFTDEEAVFAITTNNL